MPLNHTPERTLDPVEQFHDCLEQSWLAVSRAYDASSRMPDLRELFSGTNLSIPDQAAESVLVNILLEVMENVCRFSPWYTCPPRAFGLISLRDNAAACTRWTLAPEAIQKWEAALAALSEAIRKYNGLIKAILLVDGLMARSEEDDPYVTACCSCMPPRAIQIKRSILIKAEILCDQCRQPYLD